MAITKTGFKVGAGEARFGEHYKMKGITSNNFDIKVSSKDTNGEFAVFVLTGDTPKGGPPLHIHPYQDEMFYVLEGDYIFQVGEDKFKAEVGDTVFLPRHIQHAFAQLSEKGKLIVLFQPAGKMEDFFKQTSLWTSPPSQEEIVRMFEEHDMKVVGLPLQSD